MDIFKKYVDLGFNAKLLLNEMDKMGIKIKRFGGSYIMKASYKGKNILLYDVLSSIIPYPQAVIINDKYYSKKYLQRFNFKVLEGKAFSFSDIKSAVLYAKYLGFPLVLKPTVGSHGEGVYLRITNLSQLRKKITLLMKSSLGNGHFLIERQFEGNEYRLFITRKGFFAAVSRSPASVLGNGKDNLRILIEKENRKRMNPRNSCLCEIVPDKEVLKRQNLHFSYIPEKGELVSVRDNSNVSTGGSCSDVTDITHSSIKKLAKDVLLSFRDVPFVGIDLLCRDIKKALSDYAICELNGAPGLSLHMLPGEGKKRNAAKALIKEMF